MPRDMYTYHDVSLPQADAITGEETDKTILLVLIILKPIWLGDNAESPGT